jgi:hypothetical protein
MQYIERAGVAVGSLPTASSLALAFGAAGQIADQLEQRIGRCLRA